MTRVLITGGNGFIGSHLADSLVDQGEDVTLFDTHFDSNSYHLDCAKIQGDVRHYSNVQKAVPGQDVVFHFAAVSRVAWGQADPHNCWRTNQLGTVNVLEACRRSRSNPVLFYASSREVYGEPKYLPVDEAHPKAPVSVYGMTKLAAENACHSYADPSIRGRAIRPVIFRFSNVYGSERDLPERVIPKFMRLALRSEDITVYGGEQILDFTFIDDTIGGILGAYSACLNNGQDLLGEEFHFVTGRGASVLDLAGMIVKLTDSESRIRHQESNDFEVRRFVGSPQKSHKLLGYGAKVPLEQGLKTLKEKILASEANRNGVKTAPVEA